MSAPDTRLAKQKRRHRGPLLGMTLLVGVALLFFLWFLGRSVDTEGTTDVGPEATTVAPADGAADAPADLAPLPDGSLPRE